MNKSLIKSFSQKFILLCSVLLSVFLLSACSKQIQDFVTSGAQRPILGEILPTTSTANPIGIKISPGANTIQGSTIKATVSISTTDRELSGSQVKGTVTFNQARPE
mgnify:CR=1 FL=1|jgi:hypothetical protein